MEKKRAANAFAMKFETLMNMDRKNKIEDFASIGMLDPFEKTRESLPKVKA
jgi:hypothetical protein